MPNMFDHDHPDNQDGEGTSPYGNQKYGGQKFGGQTHGGNKYGGLKTGASADREELHTPDETPTPPREAIDTDRTGGGAQVHGPTFPGPSPRLSGPSQDTETPPSTDTRSWGERHSLGAKPGGNKFGGNTFGGNTFGGNKFGGGKFGASSQSNAGTERSTDEDIHPPQQPDTPAGNNAGTERSTDEDIHPPQQPETKKMPTVTVTGSRPGGGGGGKGGGGGRRKPLGDQTRTEAYDPTLDKADPRNVAIIDEQGRVNPKLYEDSQKGALDPTKPGVKTGEQAAKYTNNYTASLAGATKYMTDQFHQKPGDPLQGEGYVALTYGGVGKPDPKVVDGVFKAIDPNNELQPKEKMELATRAMHDWYVAKGDTKSADKVAGEMLQHGSAQAKIFGNTALQALKAGDKETAAKAIQGAYAWLPDGYHADISKDGKLVLHDGKGQVDREIPLDDKQMANLATGLATGTLYWDVVQHRAGVQQPFGPPKPQPTQAMATAPPGGAPGAATPSPAAAAPTAVPTPGAPPAQPPGPPGPPPVAPAAAPPPPGVTPPGTPVPPPPQPPVPSRPAAPAPAAPGPAPTQQAAPAPPPPPAPPPIPPQGSGGPPGSPAGQPTQTAANVPAPAPALDTKPPEKMVTFAPTGPGPTKPADTKPADTKVTTETAPPDTKVETGKPPPVAKADDKKAEDTKNKLVYDKDDPDSVPKVNGKEYTYRKNSTEMTPEVQQAYKDQAKLNAWYVQQKHWIFEEAGKSKSKQYTASVAALKQDIDATYNGHKKEIESKISSFNAQRRENDKIERDALKPKYPSESDLRAQDERINGKLKELVDQGDKFPLAKTSPIRKGMYDDEKKWGPIRDTIVEIHAHNQDVPLDKVINAVVTATSHLEVGPKSKQQTANDGSGPTASRFRVLGRDLSGHPVIQVGVGNSAVKLHMPENILGDIKRMKNDSYQQKKTDLEKGAKGWQAGQRIKDMAPETTGGAFKRNVGRAVDFVYGKDKPAELP